MKFNKKALSVILAFCMIINLQFINICHAAINADEKVYDTIKNVLQIDYEDVTADASDQAALESLNKNYSNQAQSKLSNLDVPGNQIRKVGINEETAKLENLVTQYQGAISTMYITENIVYDNRYYDKKLQLYKALYRKLIDNDGASLNLDLGIIQNMLLSDLKRLKTSMDDIKNIHKYLEAAGKLTEAEISDETVAQGTYEKSQDMLNVGYLYPAVTLMYEAEKKTKEFLKSANIIFDGKNNQDADKDGIADVYELSLGTNPFSADTDGDGIDDRFEMDHSYYLDPLLADSDKDGVLDGDEDFDGDKLTNKEELKLGTDMFQADTDGDGLIDYQEVSVYKTNPLVKDTDGDGMDDGGEIQFMLDSFSKDSNNNGILDGQEKFDQKVSYDYKQDNKNIEELQADPLVSVSITMNTNGDLQTAANIQPVLDNVILSNVAGGIGKPIAISANVKFDNAKLEFIYDKSKLSNGEVDNLQICWYDKEKGQIVPQENQVIDKDKGIVFCNVKQLGTYLLVNWDELMKLINSKIPFDTSKINDDGEMNPNAINYNGYLINGNDKIIFDRNEDYVNFIYSSGINYDDKNISENINNSIKESIDLAEENIKNQEEAEEDDPNIQIKENILFLVVDAGYMNTINISQENLQKLAADNIRVFLIKTGEGSEKSNLSDQVYGLNGKVINIKSEEDYKNFSSIINDSVDFDNDGLSDYAENHGLKWKHIFYDPNDEYYVAMGKQSVIYTDPRNSDTDNDGINDGEEYIGKWEVNGDIITSNPASEDTDGDGLSDSQEMNVTNINTLDSINATAEDTAKPKISVERSNPCELDTDGDGYPDEFEAADNRLKYNITPICIVYTDKAKDYAKGFYDFMNTTTAKVSDVNNETSTNKKIFINWSYQGKLHCIKKDGLIAESNDNSKYNYESLSKIKSSDYNMGYYKGINGRTGEVDLDVLDYDVDILMFENDSPVLKADNVGFNSFLYRLQKKYTAIRKVARITGKIDNNTDAFNKILNRLIYDNLNYY